jgi:hypothetical protein
MNGISVFLANAAFFYPIYWLSMLVVRAGPALLHVMFLGHRLLVFELGPLWIEAVCCPPGASAAHETMRKGPIIETSIVLVTASIVFFALRRHRALAGLLIAAIGQAALAGPVLSLLFGRRHTPTLIAGACVFAAVVLIGLTLLSSSVNRGYWKRLTAPVIGFCLPLAIFSSAFIWLGADWRIIPILTAPSLLLALIAARWAPLWNKAAAGSSSGSPMPLALTLRRLAASLAATLILVGAIHAAQNARDHSRQQTRTAFLATLPKPAPAAPYPKIFFQRGVNFTAEGPVGYDPQSAAPLLNQLKTYGVDSIALVPYGFAESKQPAIHFPGGMERTEDIEAITALAHQRGMKVMLKPQLWARAGFPGNIDFPDPRQRAQWFAAYRKYLEYYAALAARSHADIFSIGVELAKMTPYEPEWRSLVARARELYPGPLVYSATQGPEFETIRFWDALDYIGLNEYYPLPDDLTTTDVVRTVETVQKKFARPVLFTEAGFCSYAHPNRAPWDETPRALAHADQARCYEAVLKAFYTKPWFQGVYWWRVGTDASGGPEDGSHTPWGKPSMNVMKRWYGKGER